jgi:hypothetical protein
MGSTRFVFTDGKSVGEITNEVMLAIADRYVSSVILDCSTQAHPPLAVWENDNPEHPRSHEVKMKSIPPRVEIILKVDNKTDSCATGKRKARNQLAGWF